MIIPILCITKSFFQSEDRGDYCLLQPRQSATVKVFCHVQWEQFLIKYSLSLLFVLTTMFYDVWTLIILFIATHLAFVYILAWVMCLPMLSYLFSNVRFHKDVFIFELMFIITVKCFTYFCWCKQTKFSEWKIKWFLSYLILSYMKK